MSSAPDRAVPGPPFNRTRIHGAGYMGLSVACALRARGVAERVELVDPDPRARSLAAGLGFPVEGRASLFPEDPDLVVLAAPPGATEQLLPVLARQHRCALITDVTALKSPLAAIAAALSDPRLRFVGSHPLTPRSEVAQVDPGGGLFLGAPVAICPLEETPNAVIASVERLWQLLGGRTVLLSPEEHDRCLAVTGHLPVLAAAALVRASEIVLGPGSAGEHLTGAGFLDSTRAAVGKAETWAGILTRNADRIVPPLRELAADLSAVADRLEIAAREESASGSAGASSRSLTVWLDAAAGIRRRLEGE